MVMLNFLVFCGRDEWNICVIIMCSVCFWGELLIWDKELFFLMDWEVFFLDEWFFFGVVVLLVFLEGEFLFFGFGDLLVFLLDCILFVLEEGFFVFEVLLVFLEELVFFCLVELLLLEEEFMFCLGLGVVLGVVFVVWVVEDMVIDVDG